MPWHICRGSEDNFVGSDLSFLPYMGSGDRDQVTRLVPQAPLPAEPSRLPESFSPDMGV